MGTLTKKERDALEDVFLSIHTSSDKSKKLKEFLNLLSLYIRKFNFKNQLKVVNKGLKETKLSQFSLKSAQKKKNLSK